MVIEHLLKVLMEGHGLSQIKQGESVFCEFLKSVQVHFETFDNRSEWKQLHMAASAVPV